MDKQMQYGEPNPLLHKVFAELKAKQLCKKLYALFLQSMAIRQEAPRG